MKNLTKDFGSYKLHLIKDSKFKTVTIRVCFRRPIVKGEITIRNVLCEMFTQSTEKYPSKRSLTIKAQDLYAVDIQTTNSRLGNYITTDFYLSSLNDKYTEVGNLKKAIQFFSDIIFHPDVKNNRFNKEKLDIVKSFTMDSLNSMKEDSSLYSLIRMFEYLDNLPSSYRMMGYLEDLDKINEENLYQYYQDMIKNDLVDIFVIGDISFSEIEKLIQNYFNFTTFKRIKTPYILLERKPRFRRKIVKEVVSNSQSKISIGCKLYGLSDYERNYPLTLFNVILGGGSDSKLFKRVREENSLCYTIHSVPNKLDNLVIIRAGIDRDNFKRVIQLIDQCILEMKKGNFSDDDIKTAKEFYNTALDEVDDSQFKIIDNYFLQEIIGTDTISEKRLKMNRVTKEEIIGVAKKIKMDTIFLLEGDNNERN